ncbi:hypothetical protein [Thalassovita taeanensis]|uniref:Uncharacterized protein n=1 Tax=Thalassovita taeanensis TaxID=657014 RepID=A0A1H9AEF0_9RHOB|nr:hypothetical protein [Thalassovita taeanensis]SEP74813.1 hypothetical protein SAMN04488092_102102 [Thalassovita taeanensis]
MADAFNEFDQRLRRIDRSRARLKHGYVTIVDRDGLIVTRPRRVRRGVPLRGLFLLALGFLGFKALLMAHLGFGIYDDRVRGLQDGPAVEQLGAVVMQSDPVSAYIAQQIRPYLR